MESDELTVSTNSVQINRGRQADGLGRGTVCEPKACRIQYTTVTIVETKESTAVLKAGT